MLKTLTFILASYYNTHDKQKSRISSNGPTSTASNSVVPNLMKFYLLGGYIVANLID